MSERQLVVVGASLAGLRAVEAARRTGFDGSITLIGAEQHLPYDRPPLSKEFLSDSAAAPPTFRAEDTLRDELNVGLLLGTPASGVDIERREVLLDSRCVRYDALVIATGATARQLPGTRQLAGVHTLRTVDDAVAVRSALDAGARTVIVGAGFIGSEIASAAHKRGVPVTVVEALPVPLASAVGEQLGAACAALHHAQGVDLRCGVSVSGIEGDGAVERVLLSDGSVIEAELVVVGVGAAPATDWLADSGLLLENGVVCDATLCAADGVYACGDVANWHNPQFDRRMRLEHWTSAAEQGARAACNALDPGAAQPYSTVPYFWSDWYGARVQFVGVPEADEVVAVEGEPGVSERWVALYRGGDRVVGAMALNGQGVIMKYRNLIGKRALFADAVGFAEARRG